MEELVQLTIKYFEVYQPKNVLINSQKTKIRDSYKTKIEDLVSRKEFKKLQNILLKRKIELAELSTPCLVRYFQAKDNCKSSNGTDFNHLLRTYTLASRYEFDCLDVTSRIHNFKTPIPTVMKTRRLDRQTTPAREKQRPTKRAKIMCRVSTWDGRDLKCRFCSDTFNMSRQQKSHTKYDSHLVHHCLGIPDSKPLPSRRKPRGKDLMSRLAAIGAVPDPGGV